MRTRTAQLGEVLTVDRTAASPAECRDLPYVGLEHIESDAGCFTADYRRKPETLLATKFRFTQAHVLYGKLRPYLNKTVQPDFTGVCTTEILPLKPVDGVLDRGYLHALLRSCPFVKWASNSVSGANLPRLDPSRLCEYRFPLPALPEQRRIAGMLEQADRLRRTRRYALEISDTFLPAALLGMFGDPRTDAFRHPQKTLSEVCAQITDGTHITPEYRTQGMPFLSVKNVNTQSGELDFNDVRFLSREDHVRLRKACRPERGDILYTKVGATFGIPKLVDTDREFSIFVSLALLKPHRSMVDPIYLEAALSSDYVVDEARHLVSGIGVPDLHLREIRTLKIPVPPLPLQQRFAELVRAHERLRAAQRESLRQAEHLFQSLLHQAFAEAA